MRRIDGLCEAIDDGAWIEAIFSKEGWVVFPGEDAFFTNIWRDIEPKTAKFGDTKCFGLGDPLSSFFGMHIDPIQDDLLPMLDILFKLLFYFFSRS